MDDISLAPIGALLLVACLIAMLSRRLGLPYIVGLVVAGFLIALMPNAPQLPLSRELIFNILLPPLVFEGALQLDWRRFRDELPLTLTLAFFGVAIAAAVVAGGMHWIIGWSWIGAALFGTLIAATDPVSVIASFREMGCSPRVSMVVESESLLNDGVAVVGGAILLIVGRTDDPLVEITLTTLAAYGSFLIAERLHASGIISALTAGLMIGSLGNAGPISPAGRERVHSAWEYFAFLANSFVFILIGMNVASQPFHRLGSIAAVAAIMLVLAGRAVSVYPLAAAFRASRWRIAPSFQHTLFWGGLRGALALALALAVPPSVPERNAIILTAFVVVAFSILVQGLTMPLLIKRLELDRKDPEEEVAAPSATG